MAKRNRLTVGEVIPNQVFIGCPAKGVRSKYQTVIGKLKNTFPISFVIVGRDETQDAHDLLFVIKSKLGTSSHAVFDATNHNPNVSLEFGYAEAMDIPRSLYLSDHGATKKKGQEGAIISDLAGKWQNRYKQVAKLASLLSVLAKNHNYTKKFEKFLARGFKKKTKGEKKRARSLALKIVHMLDDKIEVRRDDIVHELQADQSGYKKDEINDMMRLLHKQELIQVLRGRYSTVSIRG